MTVQEAEVVQRPEQAVPREGVSVEAIAWGVALLLFFGLRLGPALQAPVGGPELVHLSGAWQASIGQADDRFVPTLFQGVAALLLKLSSSEVPARALALAVTASIPVAIFLLRPLLGTAGALLSVVVLALDPFGISIGSGASAMALDMALTCWLFVALVRGPIPYWGWGIAAFLLATAGPIPLPLVGAALALLLISGRRPRSASLLAGATGAALGILAASSRFWLGFDGLRVPPFDLFSHGYDQPWATATTGDLVLVYGLPFLVAGAAAVAWTLLRMRRNRAYPPLEVLLLVWLGVAGAWLLSSLTSHNPAPVAALMLPLALVLGPALAAALAAMFRADWRYARWLLPLAALTGAVALTIVAQWARVERTGSTSEQLVVIALTVAAVGALAGVALDRAGLPALTAAGLVILGVPALAAAMGMSFGAGYEPLPSPVAPERARNLRDVALEARVQQGGPIVIHPDLREAMTWPFRDSGEVVLASRPPAGAALVILPAGAAPPEGMGRLGFGDWALLEDLRPPTHSMLGYLHWRIDRYRLRIEPLRVDVYTGVNDE